MKADVKLVALHLRASVGGLLKEHFRIGEDILDKIFQSFAEKIADDLLIFDAMNNSIELFILLKRNIDKSIIG
ncbi:hypothetical protein JCGZ_00016 [Jatropha curcas]|uniref:Uncharacterized protein n=1 Tax=Jatropha curcas TaxID=180498 RepID=A0A067J8Q9_JATCU|nr:hypothetical protein JCGZ_00016 [Jatropha curcas]